MRQHEDITSPHIVRGFEHFIEIEHSNVSRNIALLEDDYRLIPHLDVVYSSCIDITLPSDEHLIIPAFLYLISHQEFYHGMASFLRSHKTQTFRSLRVSLDSMFTAYYLLKNPDETELYLNRSSRLRQWERVFRNVKMTIQNHQKQFPSAAGLTAVHDLCSKFAHADPSGLLHKYSMDRAKKILLVNYFEYEKNVEELRRWFTFFLFYFFRVFLTYWNEMLKKHAGSKRKHIASLIEQFREKITELRSLYPLQCR